MVHEVHQPGGVYLRLPCRGESSRGVVKWKRGGQLQSSEARGPIRSSSETKWQTCPCERRRRCCEDAAWMTPKWSRRSGWRSEQRGHDWPGLLFHTDGRPRSRVGTPRQEAMGHLPRVWGCYKQWGADRGCDRALRLWRGSRSVIHHLLLAQQWRNEVEGGQETRAELSRKGKSTRDCLRGCFPGEQERTTQDAIGPTRDMRPTLYRLQLLPLQDRGRYDRDPILPFRWFSYTSTPKSATSHGCNFATAHKMKPVHVARRRASRLAQPSLAWSLRRRDLQSSSFSFFSLAPQV